MIEPDEDFNLDEYTNIKKPERLFQITVLLLFAGKPLSKHEILSSISAYANEYKPGGNNKTLERMFERDKETLRHNGVQVEAIIPAHEDENNQATVYTIKADSFYWPKDLQLTSRQLALLNLAAEAWAGGSLSGAASKGITKLRSMGIVGEESDIIGIAPKIVSNEPNFRELNNALSDQRVVQFDYRKPDGTVGTRTVHPWLLRQIAGQWLVLGFDQDQQEPRNFMLRRMLTKISYPRSKTEYRAGTQAEIDAAVAALDQLAEKQIAVLKIKPNSEAWFRYEMDLTENKDNGELRIGYSDIHVLAEQIREYANQIKVVKPEALAQLVREGFEKVVDLHA
jgi:proteasome accessory factor B